MLYETLLQGKIFLCAIYFGLVCGIFFTIKKRLDNLFKKNKFVVLINDILIFVVATALFLICINLFNYGEFRLYELVGFACGIVLEQISLNKIVEKILQILYNLFNKLFTKLKKSKLFGKVIKWWQKTRQKHIVC